MPPFKPSILDFEYSRIIKLTSSSFRLQFGEIWTGVSAQSGRQVTVPARTNEQWCLVAAGILTPIRGGEVNGS